MIELKPGLPTQSLVQALSAPKQSITNSTTAMDAEDGQRYFLTGVESLADVFSQSLLDGSWYDCLYSPGYWAVRDMTQDTTRPFPLLRAEAGRIARWLEEIEHDLNRISEQDEWDDKNIPRLILDTSALVREGSFDTFDWSPIVGNACVRLVVPILVVRELDNLKNSGKTPKARPRLRRISQILDKRGRGPAPVPARAGATLELLMDPPRHSPLRVHDEEIIRRAVYLQGRKGGPLRLITGDYTMLFLAQTEGIDAQLTPAELAAPDSEE